MFLLGNNLKPVTPMHLERTRMMEMIQIKGSMKKSSNAHTAHTTGQVALTGPQ